MQEFDIKEAKEKLTDILEAAAQGESSLIIKDGTPIAIVSPYPKRDKKRTGTLKGVCTVPDDFDTMMAEEIEKMFTGDID